MAVDTRKSMTNRSWIYFLGGPKHGELTQGHAAIRYGITYKADLFNYMLRTAYLKFVVDAEATVRHSVDVYCELDALPTVDDIQQMLRAVQAAEAALQ